MRIRLIVLALLVFLLAACDTTSHAGYLFKSSNAVIFIDWTDNNNQLTGSVQEADIQSLQLHTTNTAITGTLSNGSVSLSASLLGFTQTLVGTLQNNQLTLSFPQQDGSLLQLTFSQATTDDYNQAVQSLQSSLQSQQATATEQQIEANNAQATAQAISNAQQQLNQALSALPQDSNFSGILSSYQGDITSAQNDLQNEQQATDCSDKKYYEQAAEYDVSQINGSILSDDQRFNGYLQTAENDVSAINHAVALLNQSMPDISQYQKAISDAQAQVKSYDSQAQQLVSQAKGALSGC